jgi:hypothetical protein
LDCYPCRAYIERATGELAGNITSADQLREWVRAAA